jgi:hypothetical protein
MTPRTRRKPAPRVVAEPWSRLSDPRHSQSLERGLAILEVFTPARPELGIGDMVSELGMSPSTTHRYAATLVAPGYLEQGERRKYRLGRVPRTQKEVRCRTNRRMRCCMRDEGAGVLVGPVALRGRLAGDGRKPPRAAAVKSRGGERRGKRHANERVRYGSRRRTEVNHR